MQISLKYQNANYQIDLNQFDDLSIAIGSTKVGVRAWYLDAPNIAPVIDGDFIGEVAKGSSVNFRNIQFNPHAHVTHTECMGHISEQIHSVNQHVRAFHFVTKLVSIEPVKQGEDHIILKLQLEEALGNERPKAIIIRTLPNGSRKLNANYSHTNPTYLDRAAAQWLNNIGVEHLLIDTPSVDREEDGGELAAHKAFWGFPETNRLHCTITEFVFVPDSVTDGMYFMNLQVAPFENDASPSRPVLYKMIKIA